MSHYNEQREADEIWRNAPVTATHYGGGRFWRFQGFGHGWEKECAGSWVFEKGLDTPFMFQDYQERPQPKPAVKRPTTSTEYLSACAKVQSERAKQYDASGTGERSFEAAAEAFNCVTGKNLRGSDVCLILEMVKLVRQYSEPTRLHEDSVLDKVSYASLWAEELVKELR